MDEVVRNYWDAGVRHIVALRGDMPEPGAAYCSHAGGYQSTPELVKNLREIRAVIEDAFAKEDLPRVLEYTERFYEGLFEGAQKHVSLAVVKTLNARINRLRALTIAAPGRGSESNREMNKLLDAIERGDGDAASAASAAHIKRTSELALSALARQEEATDNT